MKKYLFEIIIWTYQRWNDQSLLINENNKITQTL